MIAILIYIAIINLIGWFLMRYDKRQSRNSGWRVPEKNLFITAAIGGSIGIWAGMYLYRHKTKHLSFVLGIPAIWLCQIGMALAFYMN